MDTIIEAEGLRKRFGGTQALDGVDLAARRGSVLAVLGRTARARPPRSASSRR
jgi:oleandomycin transport system ATP-binding protein